MRKILAKLITKATNAAHSVLKHFVSEQKLSAWKPVHLCWWFAEHDLEIPPYFIGANRVPDIATDAASSIQTNQFTANGSHTGHTLIQDITKRGFYYMEGTSGTPTASNEIEEESGSWAGNANWSYSLNITGLSPNTSYRICAFAENSVGPATGATITVTTAQALAVPSVTTDT